MNNPADYTTIWHCKCGNKNTIHNERCQKCGKEMPRSVMKTIYNEELRRYGGIALPELDTGKPDTRRTLELIEILIVICITVWLSRLLGGILAIFTVLSGALALLLQWGMIYKVLRSEQFDENGLLRNTDNILFTFFLVTFCVLLLISRKSWLMLARSSVVFWYGWVITLIASIVIWAVIRKESTFRCKMMKSAIQRSAVGTVVIWIAMAILRRTLLAG